MISKSAEQESKHHSHRKQTVAGIMTDSNEEQSENAKSAIWLNLESDVKRTPESEEQARKQEEPRTMIFVGI
jgi:hypothetical protein